MSSSNNNNNNNTSLVADPIIAINDSYDVEESVASSALFDAPETMTTGAGAIHNDQSLLVGDMDMDMDLDRDDVEDPNPKLVEPDLEDPADTSLVEDILLGVSAPPPPPAVVASLNVSRASHPDDEDVAPAPAPEERKVFPSKAAASGTSISQVPTTITLPHSPDSSTVATPPLGDPEDSTTRNLKAAGEGAHGSNRYRHHNNNASTSCRSHTWIVASVVAFLLIVAVATSLGILLSQSHSNTSTSSSSSTSSSNSIPATPGGDDEGTDTSSTPSNHSSNKTSGSSSVSAGHDNGNATTNSNNRTSTSTTMTSKPIADVTTTPTPSPTSMSPYRVVAMQVTSQDMLSNASTPQGKAIRWLETQRMPFGENTTSSKNATDDTSQQQLLLQRYAVTVLDYALFPTKNTTSSSSDDPPQPTVGYPLEHECDWVGVSCGTNTTNNRVLAYNGQTFTDDSTNSNSNHGNDDDTTSSSSSSYTVTSLDWAGKDLTGTIPSEIGLLTALTKLDLGDNQVHGSIPEELYQLTQLEDLFLQRNALTGTLSSPGTSQLLKLNRFFAGNNQLTGPLPYGLTSTPTSANFTRHISWLSLYHNELTGPLPERTKWRTMYYLDLSHNLFTGTFPSGWVEEAPLVRLRTLYLDHNHLNGTLPTNLQALGDGRMEQLLLSDNNFTGPFPGNYQYHNTVQQLEIQHNHFTSLADDVCEMIVFYQGEMVNFKADCDICTCDYFCGQGNGQGAGECY